MRWSLSHPQALLLPLVVALASLPAAARAATAIPGDAKAGEAIYARCAACHSLAQDRTGPRHCGVIGRRAGSVPGFAYSDAMKRSKLVWNVKTLDRFLQNPMRVIPGTAMGYAGIADKQERADLIAYLSHANQSAACRP
jgi:cytochrome c